MIEDPQAWVGAEENKGKYNVRRLRKERADKGWSEYDFWNFHDYHSWMMISVLERFKTGVGYPGDVTWDEWLSILDEMIDGFKAALELSSMDTYDSKIHKSYDEWQDPLIAKHKRGMELFSKYYLSLWD
jgi:hypothetical protein